MDSRKVVSEIIADVDRVATTTTESFERWMAANGHDRLAPTPPAEGSDGGEASRVVIAELFTTADNIDAGLAEAHWLPDAIKAQQDAIFAGVEAIRGRDRRIAALEARLAKSEDGAAYMSAQCAAKSERAEAAEHALAEANEKIADLEARLAEAETSRTYWKLRHAQETEAAERDLAEATKRIEALADSDKMLALLGRYAAAMPNLGNVISWLDNGCEPAKAADELRIIQGKIDALLSPASEGKTDG